MHHITTGAIERRKAAGRSRNLYISQLKKDAEDNTNVELKILADDREQWKTYVMCCKPT